MEEIVVIFIALLLVATAVAAVWWLFAVRLRRTMMPSGVDGFFSGGTGGTGAGSLTEVGQTWVNPAQCVHSTGYTFNTELLVRDPSDLSGGDTCMLNNAALGLLADPTNSCTLVPDGTGNGEWFNMLSPQGCVGDPSCSSVVLAGAGGYVSQGTATPWGDPSCLLSFAPDATFGALSAFEESLKNNVGELISGNDLSDIRNKMESLQGLSSSDANEIASLHGELGDANSKLDFYAGLSSSQQHTLDTNANNLVALQGELVTANNLVASLQSTVASENNQLSNLKGQLNSANSSVASYADKYASLQKSMSSSTQLVTLQGQLANANSSVASLQHQLGAANSSAASYQTQLAADTSSMNSYQTQLAADTSSMNSYQTQLDAANSSAASYKTQLDAANSSAANYQSQVVAESSSAASYLGQLNGDNSSLAYYKGQLAAEISSAASYQAQIAADDSSAASYQAQIAADDSSLASLQALFKPTLSIPAQTNLPLGTNTIDLASYCTNYSQSASGAYVTSFSLAANPNGNASISGSSLTINANGNPPYSLTVQATNSGSLVTSSSSDTFSVTEAPVYYHYWGLVNSPPARGGYRAAAWEAISPVSMSAASNIFAAHAKTYGNFSLWSVGSAIDNSSDSYYYSANVDSTYPGWLFSGNPNANAQVSIVYK